MRGMLRGVGFLVLVGLISTGCAVTGLYAGSGPCRGWKTDLAACERAAENAELAANVRIGQTEEEVRGVMKTHPGRRTGTLLQVGLLRAWRGPAATGRLQ